MPLMVRGNYRQELWSSFLIPFAWTIVEGGVGSAVVRIAYEGAVDEAVLNYATGFINALPALSNISSFAWVKLAHGRPKVGMIVALQAAVIACVLVIGLLPISPGGLWAFLALATVARLAWTGIVTVRSTVWGANYPREVRARITGKFVTLQVLVTALLGAGLGGAMDFVHLHPEAAEFVTMTTGWKPERSEDLSILIFRVMVPIGCVLAGIGAWQWSKIRVRGQAKLIDGELNGEGPVQPSFNPWAMVRVLREDKRFRSYMNCQFLLGTGNLTSSAVLAIAVREYFNTDYLQNIVIGASLPYLMMPISIPLWARLLDRVHVVTFRSLHSWIFVIGLSLMYVGCEARMMWLVVASAVFRGIAFGGGTLAWNLGHLDFAPPEKASQYMGVHVTLTGVRGAMAAFIGVALYEWLESTGDGRGALVFLYGAVMTALGGIGFILMSRKMKDEHPPKGRVEPAPPSRIGSP